MPSFRALARPLNRWRRFGPQFSNSTHFTKASPFDNVALDFVLANASDINQAPPLAWSWLHPRYAQSARHTSRVFRMKAPFMPASLDLSEIRHGRLGVDTQTKATPVWKPSRTTRCNMSRRYDSGRCGSTAFGVSAALLSLNLRVANHEEVNGLA